MADQIHLKDRQKQRIANVLLIGEHPNSSHYIRALIDRDEEGDPAYLEARLFGLKAEIQKVEAMIEHADATRAVTETRAEKDASLREQIITDLKEGVGSRTNKHDILGYFTAPKFVEQFDAINMTPGAFVREYYPDAV